MIKENNQKFNLQNRLIQFASSIIRFVNSLGKSSAERYFKDQLVRSACSAALNYGESQAAESKRDFIHKVSLTLKELKESRISIEIIHNSELGDKSNLNDIRNECEELIKICSSIIIKSKRTLKKL